MPNTRKPTQQEQAQAQAGTLVFVDDLGNRYSSLPDGYSVLVDEPTQYFGKDLPTVTVTPRQPSTKPLYDYTPAQQWVNNVGLSNALTANVGRMYDGQPHPQYQGFLDGMNTVGEITSMFNPAGRAYLGYRNLTSDNGLRKTANYFLNGRYARGILSAAGDALDLTMLGEGATNTLRGLGQAVKPLWSAADNALVGASRYSSGSSASNIKVNELVPKQKPKYVQSIEKTLQGGQKAVKRTLQDSEYLESLLRELGITLDLAKQLIYSQIKLVNKQVYNPQLNSWAVRDNALAGNHPHTVQVDGSTDQFFGNNIYLDIASRNPELGTAKDIRDFVLSDPSMQDLFTLAIDQKLSFYLHPQVEHGLKNGTLDVQKGIEYAKHEAGHATDYSGMDLLQIQNHNAKYPVKATSSYYAEPTELRTRALSLRRLYLITDRNKLIELFKESNPDKVSITEDDLKNFFYRRELNKPTSNSDIQDLQNQYDREELLKYLLHFVYENHGNSKENSNFAPNYSYYG